MTFYARGYHSLKLMKQFEKFSSLKVSEEKCKAAWIGEAKHDTSKPAKSS